MGRPAFVRAVGRALLTIAASILIWWGFVVVARIPAFLLPSPQIVAQKLVFLATRADLARHIAVTVEEIVAGFALGAVLALLFAWLFARSPFLNRLFSPLIVLIQTIPKIALAPLLILWLGLDMGPKVALIAIVTFFPILAGGLAGLRGVDPAYRDLATLLKLRSDQSLRLIEAPFALPPLLAGARIASTQAVTAAVIGELMGANYGLGYLLSVGEENSDSGVVIATILVLSTVGWCLYTLIGLAERRLLSWHVSHERAFVPQA